MITLSLPRTPSEFGRKASRDYLMNALIELRDCPFTGSEARNLRRVMLGRLCDPKSREFFLYHFCPLIERAVTALFASGPHPTILDLGCGSGEVSILFALLGARVVAVDLDEELVSACRKRQAFYSEQAGPLALDFHCADALRFPYDGVAPLDGVYSLFAFNMMQPSQDLVRRIVPALRVGGKLVISDGNSSSIYNRIIRRRKVLPPVSLASALTAAGCRVGGIVYDCLLPPPVARCKPLLSAGARLEDLVLHSGIAPWLAVSYTLTAERASDGNENAPAIERRPARTRPAS